MGLKSMISKPFASYIYKKIKQSSRYPIETQEKEFQKLIASAKHTAFGKEHHFNQISTYNDFKNFVPIRDYEEFKPYIERIIKGEKNVLWKGLPLYLNKTSGTTSGIKYIPMTKESIHNQIDSARNALLCYIAETGMTNFIDGKMIFLQGSPELEKKGKIPTGRLSGIVAHHVPAYLQKNRLPSYKTNCIKDWETKVDAIVEETRKEEMTLISGIPAWLQMYFERLIEKTGKASVSEIFPNFSVLVHGGVNYEPYRPIFQKLIGKQIDTIEVYPASEGFIAYQDSQKEKGLLLVLNSGIFYEFVPVDEMQKENPMRLSLQEVELGVNYAVILNTNAGLWGYNIGDTIKFISKNPYRIIVTGRIKHFTSAFGEHVIAEEVESAIRETIQHEYAEIVEFHVAPQINPENELPYHEWFIEFKTPPDDLNNFKQKMDEIMQKKNIYYKDLIQGKILQPLKINLIPKNGFIEYMKSKGKLGGQNKIPRLANDRIIANELSRIKSVN